MNLIFKDFLNLFKVVEDVYERVRRILVPPRAYSWQTLIYLSIFSWLMSSLSTGYVKDIISVFGWIFLIAGTSWYTTDNPLLIPGTNMPVGAVITGYLVSTFAFGREEDVITPRTIVLWPTISALITASAEFFEGTGTETKIQTPKIEDRQKILVLIASCMVLSCWIQFYFYTDKWLNEYPSIQADPFRGNSLILRTANPVKYPRNGVVILEGIENKDGNTLDGVEQLVKKDLAGRRWSEVERWLIEARQKVGNIGKDVIATRLAEYEERFLWSADARVSNVKSGYNLDLLSIWSGPSSDQRGYYLKKTCRVDPVAATTNNTEVKEDKTTVAEVECDRVIKFVQGSPPPQQ